MLENQNRIAAAREKRKLKQSDLAPRIGMSRTQLANIESGARKVDLPELRQIARVLECPVSDLLLPEDVPNLPDTSEAELLASLRATPGYEPNTFLIATRAMVEAARAMSLFQTMPAPIAAQPDLAREITERLADMNETDQRRALQLLDAGIPFRR